MWDYQFYWFTNVTILPITVVEQFSILRTFSRSDLEPLIALDVIGLMMVNVLGFLAMFVHIMWSPSLLYEDDSRYCRAVLLVYCRAVLLVYCSISTSFLIVYSAAFRSHNNFFQQHSITELVSGARNCRRF